MTESEGVMVRAIDRVASMVAYGFAKPVRARKDVPTLLVKPSLMPISRSFYQMRQMREMQTCHVHP